MGSRLHIYVKGSTAYSDFSRVAEKYGYTILSVTYNYPDFTPRPQYPGIRFAIGESKPEALDEEQMPYNILESDDMVVILSTVKEDLLLFTVKNYIFPHEKYFRYIRHDEDLEPIIEAFMTTGEGFEPLPNIFYGQFNTQYFYENLYLLSYITLCFTRAGYHREQYLEDIPSDWIMGWNEPIALYFIKYWRITPHVPIYTIAKEFLLNSQYRQIITSSLQRVVGHMLFNNNIMPKESVDNVEFWDGAMARLKEFV